MEHLYSAPLLRISDVACRAPESECGAEEQASSTHVLLTRSGVFVKHVGRQQTVAEPSQALFFNAGESFRVSHPARHGDDCTVVSAPNDLWLELIAPYDSSVRDRERSLFTLRRGPLRPEVLLPYHRLRHTIRREPQAALEVEETTLRLLGRMIRDAYAAHGVTPARRPGAPRRARRDIAEATRLRLARAPEHHHSLAELARAAETSPFHLAHVFRREVGVPIHRYLLSLRLALALDRLLDRSVGLSAIAYSLGFSSHSHFTTLFRRAFGLSPSELGPAHRGAPAVTLRKNLPA